MTSSPACAWPDLPLPDRASRRAHPGGRATARTQFVNSERDRVTVRCKVVSGSPGHPGARYQQRQGPGPVGRDLTVELHSVDEPTRIDLRWHTSVATFQVSYDLAETADGTRLTQTSHISFQGAGRLSGPMVAIVLPIAMRQQLRDLKKVLESRQA